MFLYGSEMRLLVVLIGKYKVSGADILQENGRKKKKKEKNCML